MSHHDHFHILTQEGYLIHSCITQGLTALRNSSLDKRGLFYVAFFQLSIGSERMMKVTLILEHMAANSLATPSAGVIKGFGHSLVSLRDRLFQIPTAVAPHPLEFLEKPCIEVDIVEFLDRFACRTRYYNLDALSASTCAPEPLCEWEVILGRVLKEDASSRIAHGILNQSAWLAQAMAPVCTVYAHDLKKRPLDLFNSIAIPRLHEYASRYAVRRVVRIVRSVYEVLRSSTEKAETVNRELRPHERAIPAMHEFFDFLWYPEDSILRKKRWP